MASVLITSALASGQLLHGYGAKGSRSSRDMAVATFLYSLLCVFYILEPTLPAGIQVLEVFILGFKILFIYRALRQDFDLHSQDRIDIWLLAAALPVGVLIMLRFDFRTQQFLYTVVVLYYFIKAFILAIRNRKQVAQSLYTSITIFLLAYPMVFVVRSVYFLFRTPSSEFYSQEAISIYTTTMLLFLYAMVNVGVHNAATIRYERKLKAALARVVEEKGFATDLVTIIGHDLRGFLGTIKGAVGISQNSEDPALELIKDNADRAEALLTDLVYWGRSRNDTNQPAEDIVSVCAIMKAAETDVGMTAEAREVSVTLSPATLLIRADGNAVRVVLRNLLSNAIKFSEKGREVRLEAVDGGESVRITVSDDGPGMDQDLLEKINSGRYVRSEKGTGTGLNIVTSVCRAAGWPLSIDSTPGYGTRISFEVPAVAGVS